MGIPCGAKNKRSINYDNNELIRKFPIKYPNVNDLMNLLKDFITKPIIQILEVLIKKILLITN